MEAIQEAKKLLEDLCELKDLEQLLRLKEIMIRGHGLLRSDMVSYRSCDILSVFSF